MKISHPSDHPRTEQEKKVFAQGADMLARCGNASAGLWVSNTPHYLGQPIDTIGACTLDDSIESAHFLNECATYLNREHGCQHVVGPMNGNTWMTHRLTIEDTGRPSFLMEPQEPEHFERIFRQAGFEILSKYSSSSIDLTQPQKSYRGIENKLLTKDVQLRSIRTNDYNQDLASIHRLSLTSFANNFLYTPLPLELFMHTYTKARDLIDPDLVILAEQQGKLVGFVFCMPDTPSTIIIKTLAVSSDRALSGLGTVLVAKAQQLSKDKGYTEAIHALQHENNSSLRISQRFGATLFRRYALMVKSFATP